MTSSETADIRSMRERMQITLGANTAVGAGAVVTRDLPANVVAVDNPARVVREIEEEQ